MKILLLHNQYQHRGGEDVVVERERDLLLEHGHEVRLFCVSNDEIKSGFDALVAGIQCSYSESAKKRVAAELQNWRPDICHAHNLFPLLTASVYDACREVRIPVVQTLHNYRTFCANGLFLRESKPCELCLQGSTIHALVHACYRDSRLATVPVARMIQKGRSQKTLEKNVDAIIALSNFAKQKFISGGIPSEKIHVKYNFSPDLQKYKKPSGDYVIFLGRLSEEKGIMTLCDAWRPNFPKLLVVGSGALEERVRKAKTNIEVIPGANWHDAIGFLAGAKFLVMPTECYEGGIPLVLMEAASLGLPVISSKIGGIPEVFSHKKTALFFTPGSVGELQQVIQEALGDAALCESLGNGARELYEKYFSSEKAYTQLERVYKLAIANNTY